jgi:alkylation response protein AidB-like acyl-CoA dehydrogenase
MSGADVVAIAQRLADEVLFPAALATDRADTLPRALLDELAAAGLYGIGREADFATVCAVFEALSSGCLTTAFVWGQHTGTVHAAAASDNPAVRAWLDPLCSGTRRSGLALGGALPGPPLLRASRVDGGWRLEGSSPWVSGWGRIDVVHTAARTPDEQLVWLLVDAEGLHAERVALAALNATATVRADFDGLVVGDDRVTSIAPFGPNPQADVFVLRIHASFALGVIRRCCALLGPTALDDELAECRAALDAATANTIAAARAFASALALRGSAALMATVGARSLLLDEHAQRLAREALFVAVYAGRPPVRAALLARLGATPR